MIKVIYILVLLALAFATVVENVKGTPFAHEYVYGSWWFFVLWVLAILEAVRYFVRSRERRVPVVLLHVAFVVILIGAAITFVYGESGEIILYEGEPVATIHAERDGRRMQKNIPVALNMTEFKVHHHSGSKAVSGYTTKFIASDANGENKEEGEVTLNHIFTRDGYRFYQKSYNPTLGTSTLGVNHDPVGIALTYIGYAMLFASLILLLWYKRGSYGVKRETLLSILVGLLYLFFVGLYLNILSRKSHELMPVLATNWLLVHVPFVMFAYTLLAITFVMSLIALIRRSVAATLERYCRFLLYPAISALCVGIFTGAIWANVSWGNYWTWDAKETWALITLMIYAVPLHRRSVPALNKPQNLHIYLTFAFLSILMTYFGVNYLLGGMHSYN